MITDKLKTYPDDHYSDCSILLRLGLDYCHQCSVSLGLGWPGGCNHDKWSLSEPSNWNVGNRFKTQRPPPNTQNMLNYMNSITQKHYFFFFFTNKNYVTPNLPLFDPCYKFAWMLPLAAPCLPLHYQAQQLSAKFLAFSTICPWGLPVFSLTFNILVINLNRGFIFQNIIRPPSKIKDSGQLLSLLWFLWWWWWFSGWWWCMSGWWW